jgi:hypothetical protein
LLITEGAGGVEDELWALHKVPIEQSNRINRVVNLIFRIAAT